MSAYESSTDFSTLRVDRVEKAVAKEMCVKNHYSHKWNTPFGAANYGVYRDDELLGVAVYGHPMNPKSWGSITTTPADQCLELNRLWIDDVLGMNTETWLMGQSFKKLREDGYSLVQSFADGRLGVGTIYQAANFTYHGYHETTFHRDTTTGETYHDTQFSNTANATGMLFRNYGHVEGRFESFKVRTYRYLLPLNKTARRSILLPSKPYPKERAGELRIDDYTPPPMQLARCVALAEAMGDPREAAFRAYLPTITDRDPDALIAAQRENRWVRALAARNA